MHFSAIERVLAGIAAAYLAYRLWTGMQIGIIYGDGDNDVHAKTHPTAYALTAAASMFAITILSLIAIGPTIVEQLIRMLAHTR